MEEKRAHTGIKGKPQPKKTPTKQPNQTRSANDTSHNLNTFFFFFPQKKPSISLEKNHYS
jgi:hypothetical protein